MSEKSADARKVSDQPAPFTNKNDPDRRIPERQVYSGNENFSWEFGGRNIKMTGGFMEPYGHGRKTSSTLYLDSKNPDPKNPAVRTPSRYNIGIDYVVGGDQQVTPWYGGVVTKAGLAGGYGNSVTVKTNQSYEYNGKRYPIHNTYSHLDNISNSVKVGSVVSTDTHLGKMGGTGIGGKTSYGAHVDFQSYIEVDGKRIQISPNLMQDNLKKQQANGTFYDQSNKNGIAETAIDKKTGVQTSCSAIAQDLKAQYRLILKIYSADGNTAGNVDTSKLIRGLQKNDVDSKTIREILNTYFEGKGFSEGERSQQISQAFENVNRNTNNELAAAGKSGHELG